MASIKNLHGPWLGWATNESSNDGKGIDRLYEELEYLSILRGFVSERYSSFAP